MPHGQRDDVLDRAAELAADHVGVGVRPEVAACGRRPAAPRPGRCRRRRSPWRRAAPRRSPGPGSARRATATRSAPAPVTSQITSLIRLVVPSSMPFISDSSVASRRQQRRPAGEVLAQRLRRARPARRCRRRPAPRPGRAVARTAVGQPDAGQVVGVLPALGDRRRPARDGGRAACTSQPASASTLANVVPHDPAPSTAARVTPRSRSMSPGSSRTGRGWNVRRRPLAAQFGELVADPDHDAGRWSPRSSSPVSGWPARTRARCADRSTGSPTR